MVTKTDFKISSTSVEIKPLMETNGVAVSFQFRFLEILHDDI